MRASLLQPSVNLREPYQHLPTGYFYCDRRIEQRAAKIVTFICRQNLPALYSGKSQSHQY